tara:strand:- start:291 stop:740 length:450 start_codon:yes stop_codon:yes gene_type:complete
MNTREKKRKRVEPINIENVEDYLKELGVFDDLLRFKITDFNNLMDDLLLTNEQKSEVKKIRRKFQNREYSRITRHKKVRDLEQCKIKIIELENVNELYKKKIEDLEMNNSLYKKQIENLEMNNSLLEIRVNLKQEKNEEPFDFNTHFKL